MFNNTKVQSLVIMPQTKIRYSKEYKNDKWYSYFGKNDTICHENVIRDNQDFEN